MKKILSIKPNTIDLNHTPSIILVMPQLSENIGMTARAMLNCGLHDLRLVSPQKNWLSDRAISSATNAVEILNCANVYETTEEAISDLNFIGAATARSRDLVKLVQSPKTFAKSLTCKIKENINSGIMFGREKSGLTNEEISFCDVLVEVPLNPNYSSLNLAQAVLILSYEWFQILKEPKDDSLPYRGSMVADKEKLFKLFKHLEYELDKCGFFSSKEMRPMMINSIRSIIQRSSLSEQEIQIFHGIISELRYGGRDDQKSRNDWGFS